MHRKPNEKDQTGEQPCAVVHNNQHTARKRQTDDGSDDKVADEERDMRGAGHQARGAPICQKYGTRLRGSAWTHKKDRAR